MASNVTPQEAAAAAKKILGFYDTIPASDPQGFAAGLVKTLMIFPKAVVDRAADDISGIQAKVEYLNLAKIRKLLDQWAEEEADRARRVEIATRLTLPEPTPDPEVKERVSKGFQVLKTKLMADG